MDTASSSALRVRLGAQPDRSYLLHFSSYDQLPDLLEGSGFSPGMCLVVTDEQVGRLYAPQVVGHLEENGWQPAVVRIPAGEGSKSLAMLGRIFDAALPLGLHRRAPVLALGGGVVGDLAGFAASALLRGLPLVQLPTTLIAQVDSAIGGKTGINHAAGKNLIGAFHQPAFVCIDTDVLRTLPEREWSSGLAEVVKHALIRDVGLLTLLERRWPEVSGCAPDVVPELVHRAAAVKVDVVSEDERETGVRAILNFGHTFGHAIEAVAGYGVFTHGEAVAMGMRAAVRLSADLFPGIDAGRAARLVERIALPASAELPPRRALTAAMQTDKKRTAEGLRFIVLDGPGSARAVSGVDPALVDDAWAELEASLAGWTGRAQGT